MAKKGQIFNKYTLELKQEILNKYFTNQYSAGYLSKEYGIPKKTIQTWVRKKKKPEDYNEGGKKEDQQRTKV